MSNPVKSSFQHLRNLASLINSSIDALEATCTTLGSPWPSLDEPVYASTNTGMNKDRKATPDSSVLKTNPDVRNAVGTIVSAAYRLLCEVREPGATVLEGSYAYHLSAAILVAAELHVVDILRDAGSEGLHANAIAKKINVNSSKLSRILRLLATHHIFTEVRPNVFVNNRVSAVLEKGKPFDDLVNNPEGKYERPESALSALSNVITDVMFKSSAVLLETLVDARTAFEDSPGKCALAMSRELNPGLVSRPASSGDTVGTGVDDNDVPFPELSFFGLTARPTKPLNKFMVPNERLKRFGVAMRAVGDVHGVETVLSGFDFASLTDSHTLYDVGGGVGIIPEILLKMFPSAGMRIVVQERPEVCEDGEKRWKATIPEALESGKVAFQSHDFFTPQPHPSLYPSTIPIFFLKHTLHNYSDAYVVKILGHLRDSLDRGFDDAEGEGEGEGRKERREKAKLLVVDLIVPYAARGGVADDDVVPSAPEPLAANWGGASVMGYYMDLMMLTILNGQERTLTHLRSAFLKTGWEIVNVTRAGIVGEFLGMVEARAV